MEALGLVSGFGDNYLHLGHLKLFADGTMGSQAAWMLQPYESAQANGPPDAGVSLTPPDQMADLIVLDRNLFQIVEVGAEAGEVSETSVWMTLFDGQIVHQQNERLIE